MACCAMAGTWTPRGRSGGLFPAGSPGVRSWVCVHTAHTLGHRVKDPLSEGFQLKGCLLAKRPFLQTSWLEGTRAGQDPLHSLGAFLTSFLVKDNSHSYTHLILALGIVREPTLWWFITSKYIFDDK